MARHETRPERQPPARPSFLDILTFGIGTAWAILAAFKFVAGPFLPQAQEMNLLPFYYLCLALAVAHLVDGVRACRNH